MKHTYHTGCVSRHTLVDAVRIACQSQLPGAACSHAPAQIGVAAQQLRFADDVLGDVRRRENVIERDSRFDLKDVSRRLKGPLKPLLGLSCHEQYAEPK